MGVALMLPDTLERRTTLRQAHLLLATQTGRTGLMSVDLILRLPSGDAVCILQSYGRSFLRYRHSAPCSEILCCDT